MSPAKTSANVVTCLCGQQPHSKIPNSGLFSSTVAILGQKQLNTPNNGLPQDGGRKGNPWELGLVKRTWVGNLKS